ASLCRQGEARQKGRSAEGRSSERAWADLDRSESPNLTAMILSRIEKSSVQICGAVRLLAWPSQNGTPLCASADCQWCSPLQAECGVPRLNRRTRPPGEWRGRLALTADVSPQVFPLVLQAGAFADPYAGGVHGGQPNTSVFGRRFGDGALQE